MTSVAVKPLQQPVNADVNLPGCIGYTVRALNVAAMTEGAVRILRPLKSDDTRAMVEALRTLGIGIDEQAEAFVVHGDISDIKDGEYHVNVGLSGRTARSLLALLTVVPGIKTVTCAEPFKKRPIGDLVDGLRQLGAEISYLEAEGYLPVKITSGKLSGSTVRMPGSLSSQYFSAIMMIAPAVGEMTIEVAGEQSSKPFIDMTIGIMGEFGVKVDNRNYGSYSIASGQKYKNPGKYIVEPEATSASYFFAVAAINQGTVKVLNLSPDSLQGDIAFADVLAEMGCKVVKNKPERWIEVTGTDKLDGVTVDMNATPDLVPTLAVVAAFAKGTTTITSIAHARIKETDRIESPRRELAKMEIDTEATKGSFTIYGGTPKAATIDTYHDHRMAMAFAVAGTRIDGMVISESQVVSKSFPNFWEVLSSLTYSKNVVLIGMRGSGKSTVGRLLAERLGRELLNMDELIEQKSNMPIGSIVKRHGWDHFRNLETEVAHDLADSQARVIATGGGVILRSENVEALKRKGTFVFLDAPLDSLVARLKKDENDRPALTDARTLKSEMEAVLEDREAIYRRTADICIDTHNRSPEQIVDEIVGKLEMGQ